MRMKVQGQVARGFERVREAFERNFATDNDCPETGAAFAAIHRGDVIVDLWGGFADAAQTRPWQRDTMVNTYSTTKGVAAICMAVLEGRGLIDYEERVSHYWPEFAAAGKGDITVGMMLSHRGGLSGVRERLTVDDLLDWEKVTRLLAAAEPLWTPGSVAGYHAITWGFLAGELARRVLGGTSLREFLQNDVAQPLAASYHIGTPEALLP
jgi:CubicO group peptidase (beta-lactamase class C family)